MKSHFLSAPRIAFQSQFNNHATMKNNKPSQPKKKSARMKVNASDNDSPGKKRPRRERNPPKALTLGQESEAPDIEDFSFTREEVSGVRASLLEWYDLNGRDLPWRTRGSEGNTGNAQEDKDEEEDRRAYGVWVSEVMLQQTRVQTVIDYYNRWMLKWPSLHHLASASLEEVNEMWAGLGYYRRARFLLEGAQMIVAGGEGFPRTVGALRKIPGIGDYTAGAIASIAFNEVVPVVDGNVVRVLARLKAISANPKDSATVKSFWKLAAQLVDPDRPGDFNQSLMELGATACTPLNPSCFSCPISIQCQALSISRKDESVTVTDYPSKGVKTKQREEFSAVCVVQILRGEDAFASDSSESGYLLVKRPDEGLLAGLWEFPSVMLKDEADSDARREAIDHFLEQSFGLNSTICIPITREDVGDFVHIFSHIRLRIFVELLVLRLKDETSFFRKHGKKTLTWKYVDSEALSSLGLTSGVRKVYAAVEKFKKNSLPKCSQPRRRSRLKQ
ncbi:adenine DNA glycosylase [Rhodamnia argentea]|uniref:Adenine DNA glycosylase n=1 Tax=Rhodamnia argentea TaxID=178133 RepID=A0A8B8R1E8_9MYRT|nr:adenine DNA glycosylase [Rhodamnia argentea]XP_048138346.1 adenine DNA glycosylase [Rhodamnia argentea]XP_048138351.1 adenine DNA glycosylase [Rhodamnia argentea]XP_048138355.1 adenine DNA glycosylase [Rhodamnia argentea]